MSAINLAAAKAQLSELIYRAEGGEEILITRHGQPVVRISAVEKPKKSLASRAAFRAMLPGWSKDSSKLLRTLRDEE